VWPTVLNSGTSETDISVKTAGKLGFERGKAYSLDLDLRTLQYGTKGGFTPVMNLSELGEESEDLFVGGGANLKGAGSASFLVDGDRDAKGNITPKSKHKVVAANNGLLNVLRLGSALRSGYESAASSQPTTSAQGPKGRYNVVAARMQTGQDSTKSDVRQEDSYQRDNGNRIVEKMRHAHERLVAALMKEAGVPDEAVVNRISPVVSGYNAGLEGVLGHLSVELSTKPEWYFMPADLDLTGLASQISVPTWSAHDKQAGGSLQQSYLTLWSKLKEHLAKKATVPGMKVSGNNDKNFMAVRAVLVEQVRAGIQGANHKDFMKTYHAILFDEQKEVDPTSIPAAKGERELQQFNTEGGVGGS
jgi:hypothetical protein